MTDDDATIPSTVSQWQTAVGNDIPRTKSYQPPARLQDFLAFVRAELPEEQAQVVLAAAERFRARGWER